MNVQTFRKLICTAALLPLLAAPLAANAGADEAMDACIKAFVASNVPKEHPVSVQKSEQASSPIGMRSSEYTIQLSAVGKTSGKPFGKATCVADGTGQVIALNGKPVAAPLLADSAPIKAAGVR